MEETCSDQIQWTESNPGEGIGTPCNDKKFSLRNIRMLLTYTYCHANKAALREFFATFGEIDEVYIAHETGHSTGVAHPHTHVLLKYKKALRTTNPRLLDIIVNEVAVHPNIRPINTNAAYRRALKYVCKEDPELAEIRKMLEEEDKPPVTRILRHDTMLDMATKEIKSLGDALPAFKIWRELKVKPRLPQEVWHPKGWQLDLLALLEGRCRVDDRGIIWVVDYTGNSGKTDFKKRYSYIQERVWTLSGFGKQSDVAHIIAKYADKCNNPHAIIVDLPRQNEQYEGMYASFEAMKNGCMVCCKYDSQEIEFSVAHLVIFANFLPHLKEMSMDRWHIYEIQQPDDSGVKSWKKLDTYEVLREQNAFESELNLEFSDSSARPCDYFRS